MPYTEIQPIHAGATVSEFVDKINEIIAAMAAYRPVTDYRDLDNKPSINNVELDGQMNFSDLGIDLSGDSTIEALSRAVSENRDSIMEQASAIDSLAETVPDDKDIAQACEKLFVRKDMSNVEETVMAGKDGYIPVVGANGEVGKMRLENATAMVTTMQEAARSAADTALKEKRSYIPVEYNAGSATVTATTAFRIGTTLLHINGVLQAEGTDYTCTDNQTIELLTYVPVSGDIIQLMAIPAA